MKIIILLTVALTLVSCTRASKTEVSSLKFDFSKINQKGASANDIDSISNLPADTEVCYAVNVLATDLPEKNQKCAPKFGIFGGFISESGELSIDVPFGKGREVQLYAYLPKKGTPCPRIDLENSTDIDPTIVYQVGKLSGVVFDQPETKLEMPVSFPGATHSIYTDLQMDASCMKSSSPSPVVLDPNTPIVLKTSLSTTSITSIGVDVYLTLSMLIKSPTPLTQIVFSQDGPNGNISNYTGSQMFYACTLANITSPGHICENATVNDYYGIRNFTASQWAPNGIYRLTISVTNTLSFTSPTHSDTVYTITNHAATTAPVITNIQVTPDSGLMSGSGGSTTVKILVQSNAPPDFLEKTLKRPDMGIIYVGGSSAVFLSCSGNISNGDHICYGASSLDWYYEFTDYFNMFRPNGTYSYTDFRVRNAGTLFSPTYGPALNFTISGNVIASTPVINQVNSYYAFDMDPIIYGIPFYNSTCVRATSGSSLNLAVRLFSTSNVEINRLNYTLQGPSAILSSGGQALTSSDVGGGVWQTEYATFISNIVSSSRGIYGWNNLSVQNLGDVLSTPTPGHFLNVQDSCATTYLQLSSSNNHTCGITNDGLIRCWGDNAYNKIDHGTATVNRSFPTVVEGNKFYQKVSAGSTHTCAITSSGQLECWGQNTYGQIGDGTNTNVARAKIVDPGVTYLKVSSGGNHTCGITTTGALKCWGRNAYGQIGDSTMIDKMSPVTINSGTAYSQVNLGENHTCGITSTGVLKCWGRNVYGQIGDGTTINKTSPVIIDSGVMYDEVDSGLGSTCGIATSGVLKCWGQNTNYQLGDSTATNRSNPTVINSGTTYMNVSVSVQHACGITTAGILKCWGTNAFGQVGDGSTTLRSTPITVDSGVLYSKVAIGSNHSCAVTSSGIVKCWGQNVYNQLGNGSSIESQVPTANDL